LEKGFLFLGSALLLLAEAAAVVSVVGVTDVVELGLEQVPDSDFAAIGGNSSKF
jgi:hypothetical protein